MNMEIADLRVCDWRTDLSGASADLL